MRIISQKLSHTFLICLFSVFLIGAGISRYIETDSGNILIHDIDLENVEGFFYKGRLFRPIQASSMNQRPGILMVFGDASDRYTGDHIAMELARRGFTALTIEDFSHGSTDPEPPEPTENLIDAGYTFLSTRTFTDHERIGLLTFYSGADKVSDAAYYSEFKSCMFVSPKSSIDAQLTDNCKTLSASYETSPEYRFDPAADIRSETVFSSHAGMIFHASVISTILEHFHDTLPIPNDSPFWFDASSQRAQLLLSLRFFLLIILVTVSSGQGALIIGKTNRLTVRTIAGILIPLVFLSAVEELMNFFMISIRLGSPFNYLPRISQLFRIFSPVRCILSVFFSVVSSLAAGKKRFFMITDFLAGIGSFLCLFGFLPVLFGHTSGWEFFGIFGYRYFILLVTAFSLFNSFLLRLPENNNYSRSCRAVLNGLIFYWLSSNLPLNILFQE
ncbi:MAG: hypothetical protein IJI57_12375 [Flexilinea sp.]|nr:hypothetical protein [Flexilinea sp.]